MMRFASFLAAFPALIAAALVFAAPVQAQTVTIDTIPDFDASTGNFGVGATATFGQIIVAPPGSSVLTDFTFVLRNFNGTPIVADAEVYAWDGAKATGPALSQSAPFTIAANPTGDSFANVPYTVTPNVPLIGGQTYVLLFTTSGLQQGQADSASQFCSVGPGTYSGGGCVFLDSGNDHSLLNTSSDYTAIVGFDLAFQANFTSLPGHTHILWTRTDGTASLWSVTSRFSYTQTSFGPYPGWTARAVSDAPNGTSHILWTKSDGTVSVWNVMDGKYQGEHDFGPYSGWTAVSLSTGGDGQSHLLWNNVSGAAAVWSLNTSSGAFTQAVFGPYPGWTARTVASGAAANTLLWTNTDGRASSWRLGSGGSLVTHDIGPFSGWAGIALSVGPDDGAHLLWGSSGGTAALWGVNLSTNAFRDTEYGPYNGWSARKVATGPDGATHLLWVNTDGRASLWGVGASGAGIVSPDFGPFSGWTAVGLSAGL